MAFIIKKIKFAFFGGKTVRYRGVYAVNVHVDVDNNSNINSGDFINMESCPVISHGYPKDNVSVHVKETKSLILSHFTSPV